MRFAAYLLLLILALPLPAQVTSTNGAAASPDPGAAATTNAPFDPAAAPVDETDKPLVSRASNSGGNSAPAPGTMRAPTLGGAPGGEDIEDIRPPFFYLRSWFWLWVILGAIAGIALLIALWRWLRPTRMVTPQTAYDLALAKLEKARSLINEEAAMPYALAASEAVRTYLGQRFQSPSSRRTTEEFLRQMEANPATPLAPHRDLLRHFLSACDLVKFARYQPGIREREEVHERAVSFVTATKPEPIAPNGAAP